MSMTVSLVNSIPLAHSGAYCEQLTKAKAKNFYYGLKLLPEPKRSAMFALYAYMRLVDDIADEDDGRSIAQRLSDLEAWRTQTHAAAAGKGINTHPVWPAFANIMQRYRLPIRVFDEVIAGQRQDLEPAPFANFEQLYEYCYRVAGVVGLASIFVWGFEGGEQTEQLAVDRGVAFQLTNILRDLKEDSARGRIYLPQDELKQLGVSEEDLHAARGGRKFREMMRFQIDRAEHYYRISAPLEKFIARDSRATMIAMTDIYRGLLKKVACEPERVLRERVSLSLFSKLRIGWRATRVKC